MKKLIITIAHTGNVPTKEMNAYTPLTPEEIATDIDECASLGASIAHIHARDQEGKPTSDRDVFASILHNLSARGTNVIRQLSTGARGGENTIAYRGQMLDLGLDVKMASLATGSSNFPGSINANSPELIEALALKMKENGIKPEIEAFDLAMISNAVYLEKKGILKGPLHFNLVMNVPGSISGTPRNLLYMVESLPPGATWTLTAVGKCHVQLISIAIALGGHVRTGLEDVIYYDDNKQLASNPMLVKRAAEIASAIGRPIASPEEAMKILSL